MLERLNAMKPVWVELGLQTIHERTAKAVHRGYDLAAFVAALDPPPDGVKLQMLHVLRGTQLGEDYEKEPFQLLTLEEYAELVAQSVRILPEETVIHRLTGDAPGPLLIAPEWTRNKKRVLNAVNREIAKR